VLGLFFSILTLIVVVVIPSKKSNRPLEARET